MRSTTGTAWHGGSTATRPRPRICPRNRRSGAIGSLYPACYDAGMASSDPLTVDLALVLAVDCSTSVDFGDFRLQMDGLAAALRHPALAKAIAGGEHRQIAISLMLWSDRWNQHIVLPWTLLAGNAALEIAAQRIAVIARKSQPGGTGLAAGIDYAALMLKSLPFTADRRAIDV